MILSLFYLALIVYFIQSNDILALKAGNYLMKPDPSDPVYSKRAAEAAAGR